MRARCISSAKYVTRIDSTRPAFGLRLGMQPKGRRDPTGAKSVGIKALLAPGICTGEAR